MTASRKSRQPNDNRKPTPGPRVRLLVTVGSCELFAPEPVTCPLCRQPVPANTPHKCEVKA
jgi:hypothetical protein